MSKDGHVTLYDSAIRLHYRRPTREVRYGISIEGYAASLRNTHADKLTIDVADVEQIKKDKDSGTAAVFHTLMLLKGVDPEKISFNYKSLGRLLVDALENGSFEDIPEIASTPRPHRGTLYAIEVPLFCFCEMPDMGTPMISCNSCEKWYHSTCVGVAKANSNWLCKNCKGSREKHKKLKRRPSSDAESAHNTKRIKNTRIVPLPSLEDSLVAPKTGKCGECTFSESSEEEEYRYSGFNLPKLRKYIFQAINNGTVKRKLDKHQGMQLPKVTLDTFLQEMVQNSKLKDAVDASKPEYDNAVRLVSQHIYKNYDLPLGRNSIDLVTYVSYKMIKKFLKEFPLS